MRVCSIVLVFVDLFRVLSSFKKIMGESKQGTGMHAFKKEKFGCEKKNRQA